MRRKGISQYGQRQRGLIVLLTLGAVIPIPPMKLTDEAT